jgi:hypothetical protein
MWYDALMPQHLNQQIIDGAETAVEHARSVRRVHARRTKRHSPQRQIDLELALERLKEAMKPLKSEIGRFPYGPASEKAEANRQRIRDASALIQTERRKLWKMMPHG